MFVLLFTIMEAIFPVGWATVGDFFGRKSFGTIRGNMNLFYTWGSILGPFIAGAVYDRTESYALVFSAITVAVKMPQTVKGMRIRVMPLAATMFAAAKNGASWAREIS